MARETLEAVKQMELNAARIESQAIKKYDEILLSAEKKARNIVSVRETEALEKVENEMKNAKVLGNEMLQNSIVDGNEEKIILIKKAREDEKAAIELILSQII